MSVEFTAKLVSPQAQGVDRDDELAIFYAIANVWGLSTDDQMKLLGSPARSTFFKWKKERQVDLPRDTKERISHLASIVKALEILMPGPGRADAWIKRANDQFDGQSALTVMLGGQVADIYHVRAYVDAQRGG